MTPAGLISKPKCTDWESQAGIPNRTNPNSYIYSTIEVIIHLPLGYMGHVSIPLFVLHEAEAVDQLLTQCSTHVLVGFQDPDGIQKILGHRLKFLRKFCYQCITACTWICRTRAKLFGIYIYIYIYTYIYLHTYIYNSPSTTILIVI